MVSEPPSPAARPLRPNNELRTAWLLLLLDREASYGYGLRRELEGHQLNVDPAILYRTLRKLEGDGWVESRWMRAVSGPRRRFYRLTPKGRRKLDEVAGLIMGIRQVHDTFLRAYEQARDERRGAAPGDDETTTPS